MFINSSTSRFFIQSDARIIGIEYDRTVLSESSGFFLELPFSDLNPFLFPPPSAPIALLLFHFLATPFLSRV